jgi:hypothetical protein
MTNKIKKTKTRRKTAEVIQRLGVVNIRREQDLIPKNFFEISLLMTTPSSNLIFRPDQKTRATRMNTTKGEILKEAKSIKLTK